MPRGGKREGAGRKKGSLNKVTEKTLALANDGESPVEFLLGVMRDESKDLEARKDAAKSLLPYTSYRLQAVELSGEVGHRDVFELSDEELIAELTAQADREGTADAQDRPALN